MFSDRGEQNPFICQPRLEHGGAARWRRHWGAAAGAGEHVLGIHAVARLGRILFAGCRDRPELVRGGGVQGVECRYRAQTLCCALGIAEPCDERAEGPPS